MKYYYFPVPPSEKIFCFSCGQLMKPVKGEHVRECPDCEVTELRLQGEYIVMTRLLTSGRFFGEDVIYIDHSLEYCPHP